MPVPADSKQGRQVLHLSRPESPEQFAEYYELRWRILRAPWKQPRGSEKDEWEDTADHISAHDAAGQLVGIGRVHLAFRQR